MKTVRILGPALACILGFLALGATPAGATAFNFAAAQYTAEVTGQQQGGEGHVFTAEGGLSVKCKIASLTGTLTKAATELEVTPAYAECSSAFGLATIAVEGCKYKLDVNGSDMDIACPPEKAIKVTTGPCEMQVGSQTNRSTYSYANGEVLPSTVSATANLKNIKYTKTKDGPFCPFFGTGIKEDGTASGQTVLKGTVFKEPADFFVAPQCEESWSWPEDNCAYWESPEQTEAELESAWEEPEEEWPEEENSPEEEEEKGHDPILFVHGYRGDLSTFATMKTRFEADGWPKSRLHNWQYKWWISNETIGMSVKAEVENFLAASKASEVDIVTHSMGALSTRYYIGGLWKGWEKVEDWVSLGSPNRGSYDALGCIFLYKACEDMAPGSTLLKTLSANETPAGVRWATWRSPCDWAIIGEARAMLGLTGKAQNTQTGCLRHSALHEDKKVYEEVRAFVEQ
jgi:pimeloyl-ACP methyl ester carboxylesterase